MKRLVCGVAALGVLLVPSAGWTVEPVVTVSGYVGWTERLPPLPVPASGDPSHRCSAQACPERVIAEMIERWRPLNRTCDHNAVFALTYLRTTQEYLKSATTPGYFRDGPYRDAAFVNYEDLVFANYYFQAYDGWTAGDLDAVPEAWRVAFAGAADGTVSAAGDILLGINAHVNRDLPYVLWQIGIVQPDGGTAKHDHDKVNEFLANVDSRLTKDLARRYDPSLAPDTSPTASLSGFAGFQILPAWREIAWRNAEALTAASTAEARAAVAAEIEAFAGTQARVIAEASRSSASQSAARDAYCAANVDDELSDW